jgi:hypothetical protein
MDQLLPLIVDMDCEGCHAIQDRKDSKVSPGDWIHLGAAKTAFVSFGASSFPKKENEEFSLLTWLLLA